MTTNNLDLNHRIGAEQVRSAYSNTAPGMSATVLGAVMIAAILAATDAISTRVATVFGSVMILQIGARLLLISAYHRRKPPDHEWRRWARRFTVGALAASLTLGVSSWWLLAPGRFDMQLLVMLYLCAVASGAITAFGVLRMAIYTAIIPMMLLPIAWLIAQDDRVHWMLALLTTGWLFAIADQARRYSAQFEESVRLRFENEDLITRLRGEKLIAEEASAAKSRFLAAASHDLRQPVHALTLFVAALRPRVTDAEANKLLDHIDSSVQAMGSLFNGLLDISRLDAGVVEVNAQTFALQPMLERICRDHAGDAEAKKIGLRLRPTAAIVYSDPLLIERVVRNIVSNAVAYTDSGRVLVACRKRGRSTSVEVWDSGRGIPEAEQAQIFKEFYQVANPERDRSKGVGLGLAIVRRLTALLGHPLRVRSAPNRGSWFALELPQSDAAVSALLPVADDVGDLPATGLILVVDDEATIQMAMKSLLEGWGFRAIVAGTCDEMLAQLADCPDRPALIVCDYRLRAHEDGIHVIERLRAEYNDDDIPGMLITGDTAPDRLKEAQESGLLLLHKPVSNSRLRAAITHLVARPVTPPATTHPGSRGEIAQPASG